MKDNRTAVLLISGTMGSGKTTVLGEMSDVLSQHGVHHAAIDMDTLGCGHLPGKASADHVMMDNLASVWRNYAAAGAHRVLLARAVETLDELTRITAAIPSNDMTIVRLTADRTTLQRRIAQREPGMNQNVFMKRATELDKILSTANLEHFVIVNDGQSMTEVAQDILMRAEWLS